MITRAQSILAAAAAILAVAICVTGQAQTRAALTFVGVKPAPALTKAARDQLLFAANAPKKGANQAFFVAAAPVAAEVTRRTSDLTPRPSHLTPSMTLAPFPPDEEEGTTNFPAYFPANATWTFTVVERYPGARCGPYSYGLKRSFDGGKTWTVWTKWINDTFRYDTPTNRFEQSVTLMCDAPINNRLVLVQPWASNTP